MVMTTPDWLVTVNDVEMAHTSAKISKASDGEHPHKDKKARPARHVRARAKLPTSGPEAKNYTLPDWVGEDSFKQMISIMLKTIANTQQRIRVMESVIADNFVVPSKITPVTCGITAAEMYHKKATAGNDLGPPAPHVFFAFCDALYRCEIGEEPKDGLKREILDKIRTFTVDKASGIAAVFTIKPCHDPANHKVILVTQNVNVRAAFVKAITCLRNVKHYTAPAPASGQEDEIQKWIEKLENFKTEF